MENSINTSNIYHKNTEIQKKEEDFGQVLKRYRKEKEFSQKVLAQNLNVKPNYISMLEKSDRKPTREKIIEWSEILKLDRQTLDAFLVSAGYSPLAAENIILIARRDIEEEASFQNRYNFDVIWVIADKFLDLEKYFYKTVKNKICEGKHYVYFQSTPYNFRDLLLILKNENDIDLEMITKEKRLECIIAPPTLFFFRFAIYDPGTEKMFGRVIQKGNELVDISEENVKKIYDVLKPIYDLLEQTKMVSTSCGEFWKFFPEVQ